MSKLNISNQKFYAGAKVSWTESVSEYPASLYDLKVYLKYRSDAVIEIDATAAGDDYSLEKTLGSSITSGDYPYQCRFVEKADPANIILYEVGVIHVYPDLTAAGDSRSKWMMIYDNLMAAYQTLSSREAQEVILYDGTRVNFSDRIALLKEIHNAEIKAGIKKGNKKVYARFI